MAVGYGTLFPLTLLEAVRARGRARSTGDVEVVLASKLQGFLIWWRRCGLDLKIPVSLNRPFSHMVRVVCAKMHQPLIFARHVEAEIMKVQKPMSATLNEKPDTAL